MADVETAVARTTVAAAASLAPLYALMSMKSRLRLDNVHIVLAQLLVLALLRFAVNLTPRRVANVASKTQASLTGSAPAALDSSSAKPKKRTVKRKKAATGPTAKKGENPQYPFSLMDASLYRFLSIVDPTHLDALGPLPAGSRKPPAPLPLNEWTPTYDNEGVRVLKHPQFAAMYAICYRFADAELRKVYEILVDITKRPSWDALCEGSEQLVVLGPRDQKERVTERLGSVSWMAMKGQFPIKAKDLVMLSVSAQLPPSPSTIPSTPDKPVLRIVCATTSVENDSKPPGQKGYARMELDIAGFVLEEDGQGGVLLTQLTDLSGLGSWVPTKIINLVTQTMIPKSLARIGKRAAELQLEGHRANLEGDAWLPPLLGAWRKGDEEAASAPPAAEEEEEVEEEEDDDDAPVSARTLNDLLEQLRTLTARLGALEGKRPRAANSSSSASTWLSRWWPFSTASLESGTGGLTLVESGIISALGGAASALTIWGLALPKAKRAVPALIRAKIDNARGLTGSDLSQLPNSSSHNTATADMANVIHKLRDAVSPNRGHSGSHESARPNGPPDSGERGREGRDAKIASTGRGGAGNFSQTPSVARNGHRATVDGEDVQTVTSAEERSRSRSRSRAPHGKLMEHTGRGGAGNVRMESKERERAAAAQEKLDQDVQSRYTAEQLQHHHHHGRGGAGNTV